MREQVAALRVLYNKLAIVGVPWNRKSHDVQI
jgi:hypothetical protein